MGFWENCIWFNECSKLKQEIVCSRNWVKAIGNRNSDVSLATVATLSHFRMKAIPRTSWILWNVGFIHYKAKREWLVDETLPSDHPPSLLSPQPHSIHAHLPSNHCQPPQQRQITCKPDSLQPNHRERITTLWFHEFFNWGSKVKGLDRMRVLTSLALTTS